MIKSNRFSGRYWLRLGCFTTFSITLPLLVLLLNLVQRQLDILVTPIRMPLTQTPQDIGLPFEDATLTTRDGLHLVAWYIPGSRPEAIILVHGLNTNRQVMLPTAELLAEAGYPLLLLDLRGHGQSEGKQLSYGYREAWDVQAGVDYLTARPEIKKVAALGSSLGGATVTRAAALEPRLAALVIQSSYSSLPAAVEDGFDRFSLFPKWPFGPLIVALAENRVGLDIRAIDSTRDLATMSPRPVLIIHNASDKLFPLYHAQTMYQAAQPPKDLWVIESLAHADPALALKAVYQKRVVTFFDNSFAED